MNLVIVESPTKARTLSRFLGKDFRIEATLGHIRDLPKSKLGVEIEKNFTPLYVIPKDKKKKASELKKIAQDYPKVILATDPDREGEAIAYHIVAICADKGSKSKKFLRIVFHEITKQAINKALLKPRSIDINLVDAQQARRILDRLVGYKLSPLLWVKVRKGLSAGRVQSVAVRLIVEREREIEAFKQEEYWVIQAELEKKIENARLLASTRRSGPKGQEKSNNSFLATLIKISEEKAEIKNEKQAKNIVSELEKASYQVLDVSQKEVVKNPYPPFKTSTLQAAAANLFGWSSKNTMQIAQKLYEQGFITYHRTDSFNLASQALTIARKFIKDQFGEKYLPEKPKIYKTKSKIAQEAHEAIRPTRVGQIANDKLQITKEINRSAMRLYELIWKRFLACQMNGAVDLETKADIEAKNKKRYLLQAKGVCEKFPGWRVVYHSEERNQASKDKKEKKLPLLTVNEPLSLIQVLPQQKFTQPPARYSEATLIKVLEEKGIGRPSTYAPIISTIQERQYVEKIEAKFKTTLLGTAVNDFLVKNFEGVINVSFTAKMEDDLDKIAKGEEKRVPVIKEFYQPFEKRLNEVFEKSKRVKVEVEETDEICPKCGGKLVIRIGRYGKFLACSKFPDCDYTASYVEKTGLKCPKCQGEVIVKKTKKGKRFYGCSNYPKCKFASWKKPKEEKGEVKE